MSDQDRHEYEVERELYEHMEEEQHWTEHEKMIEDQGYDKWLNKIQKDNLEYQMEHEDEYL